MGAEGGSQFARHRGCMRVSIPVLACFVVCASYGCADSGRPSPPQSVVAPTPVRSPPPVPVSGNGINGPYQGDLTFTEEDTSYGWPAHLTVTAYLRQNGAVVTGNFNLLEIDYSGGDVKGAVDTAAGTFTADFWPNDLGDHFAVDTHIVSPDGGRLEGTFVFAEGVVGHGTATFTRVK